MNDDPETVARRLPLACPYCGGTSFSIEMRSEGVGYLSREVPEEIECDWLGCQGSWKLDGTPVQAANWVEWPTLYAPPGPSPSTGPDASA